jgi:hypothetical protein
MVWNGARAGFARGVPRLVSGGSMICDGQHKG